MKKKKEVENSTREGSIQNNVIIIISEKVKKNSSGEKVHKLKARCIIFFTKYSGSKLIIVQCISCNAYYKEKK